MKPTTFWQYLVMQFLEFVKANNDKYLAFLAWLISQGLMIHVVHGGMDDTVLISKLQSTNDLILGAFIGLLTGRAMQRAIDQREINGNGNGGGDNTTPLITIAEKKKT